jgi:HEAT repeat protein
VSAELAACLVEALQDDDTTVVQNICNALVALGPKAVPCLIKGLTHKDKNIRSRAADALGKMGTVKEVQAALPALLKALKDKEVEVRRSASWAINQIIGRPPTPPVTCASYSGSLAR